jgi:preprotein translocase subunit SecA
MDDSLMRIFGGERVKSLMGTFKIPEDQPIEMGFISKTLEGAQTKIEGFHFDARKQVLAYDNVLNLQRQSIYVRRRNLLLSEEGEVEKVREELITTFPDTEETIKAKEIELGSEVFTDIFRRLTLQTIDMLWVEHLEVMGYTRSSVSLRAYGQRDPLIEYRREGNRLFKEMQEALNVRIAEILPRIQPQVVVKEEAERKQESEAAQVAAGETAESVGAKHAPVVNGKTYGRNDLVTVTNGIEAKELKYKKAEELLMSGWKVVEK